METFEASLVSGRGKGVLAIDSAFLAAATDATGVSGVAMQSVWDDVPGSNHTVAMECPFM